MSEREFDLSKMTVDDLFRAKDERRQRLANLPFERKIEIVKKLQSISREALKEADQKQSEQDPQSTKPS
jgi:hypothetical protein